MGIACGDLDGDGQLDLAVTNFFGESTTFYRNLGRDFSSTTPRRSACLAPSRPLLGFGIAFPRRQQRRLARPDLDQRSCYRLPAANPLEDAVAALDR